MTKYIQVLDDENEVEIEIPIEEDGTLLLSTLSGQFPNACGLKYKNPQTGGFRGVRLCEGRLHPPEKSWGTHVYYVVFLKGMFKCNTIFDNVIDVQFFFLESTSVRPKFRSP